MLVKRKIFGNNIPAYKILIEHAGCSNRGKILWRRIFHLESTIRFTAYFDNFTYSSHRYRLERLDRDNIKKQLQQRFVKTENLSQK